MKNSHDISAQVDAALADNPAQGSIAAVIAAGDKAVPILASRLEGLDSADRTDILSLLAAIGTPATIPVLLPLMADEDWDTRQRSARAVYAVVIAHGVPKSSEFSDQVLASLGEEPVGAALLLAGFVPKARKVLIAYTDDKRLVKLNNDGPAVSAETAATMALALLGETEARTALESSIHTADAGKLEFYLDAIHLIDDTSVLHDLSQVTLSNMTPIGSGLPAGITPPRRLADHAVETFVQRLKLQPGFSIDKSKRYSDQEFSEIRQQIERAIPR